MKKKKTMMIFWKYDLYPYLLCGEADVSVEPKIFKGHVTYYVPSFQSYFAPKFVLPNEEGNELARRLAELKSNKKAKEDGIRAEYDDLLDKCLSEFGVSGI